MGDWAKGEFLSAGLKPNVDFLCRPSPGTQGVFDINTDTFVMFKVADPEIKKAQLELARLIVTPEVQTQFNRFKGSVPAVIGGNCEAFDPCGCSALKDLEKAAQNNDIVPSFAYFQANEPEAA